VRLEDASIVGPRQEAGFSVAPGGDRRSSRSSTGGRPTAVSMFCRVLVAAAIDPNRATAVPGFRRGYLAVFGNSTRRIPPTSRRNGASRATNIVPFRNNDEFLR
jgi:hypothetical protein